MAYIDKELKSCLYDKDLPEPMREPTRLERMETELEYYLEKVAVLIKGIKMLKKNPQFAEQLDKFEGKDRKN